MKKKISGISALLLICCLTLGMTALAGGSLRIVETQVFEDDLNIYVKNAGEAQEIQAVLGKQSCSDLSVQRISEGGIPVRTLVLLDNSLSIPAPARELIRDSLTELIAARKDNDYFALGTIGESVEQITDYSKDYTLLKETLDSLEYVDQETYLTDALYEYLEAGALKNVAGSFNRILIVSDGVDNKEIGYTTEELLSKLKENPMPVYMAGVLNKNNSNTQEIENMFSIARATGAESILLNEMENPGELVSLMGADQDNLRLVIRIPEEMKDGSIQTLTLTIQNGGETVTLSADGLRMPSSIEMMQEEQGTEMEEASDEPSTAALAAAVPQAPQKNEDVVRIILGIIIGLILLTAAIVLLAFNLKKRKKDAFKVLPPKEEKRLRETEKDDNTTLIIGAEQAEEDHSGDTVMFWDGQKKYRITLTDVKSPVRSYQKPIDRSVIIGYSAQSDICIDFDKSVSRKQCEIIREGEIFYIVNYSNTNGTLLDGKIVVSKTQIKNGSVLKMGRVEMRIEIGC